MPTGAELLEQAIQFSQAGEKKQAGRILALLIKQEQDNEQAWWWLAGCVDSPQQKLDCYQRVLRINPMHAGARMALLRLQANLPLPDPAAGLSEAVDTTTAVTSPLLSQIGLGSYPTEPEVEELVTRAAQAEALDDYQAAYDLYARAVAIDSSHALAWLGKGYAAGRLSTPATNGIPEFFDCLTRAVLSRDRFGLTLPQALTQLDPAMARTLADRLRSLSAAVARLAGASPPSMANVFAIERVRLADCAYAASRRLNPQDSLASTRAELVGIALDALGQIIAGVRQSTYSARDRHELAQTFRGFLLGNLTASGLNQDSEFLRQVDALIN